LSLFDTSPIERRYVHTLPSRRHLIDHRLLRHILYTSITCFGKPYTIITTAIFCSEHKLRNIGLAQLLAAFHGHWGVKSEEVLQPRVFALAGDGVP